MTNDPLNQQIFEKAVSAYENEGTTVSEGKGSPEFSPNEPKPQATIQTENLREKNVHAGCYGEIGVYGLSLQGRNHIAGNIPCQDYHQFEYLRASNILIAAIADGVGSCSQSHYGAEAAVCGVLEFLEKRIEFENDDTRFDLNQDEKKIQQILQEAFCAAQTAVESKADELDAPVLNLQSTLTVALYDGHVLWFGHIGDDGIVAQGESGNYKLVTRRDKGEEATSVYTLQSDISNRSFHKIKAVSCFMMSTDGVLDSYVRGLRENQRVFYPFFENRIYSMTCDLEQNRPAAVESACKKAEEYLNSEQYRKAVGDDLTLLAVANLSSLQSCTHPMFDKKEWDEQTNEYRRKAEALLYNQKPTASPKQSMPHSRTPSPPQPAAVKATAYPTVSAPLKRYPSHPSAKPTPRQKTIYPNSTSYDESTPQKRDIGLQIGIKLRKVANSAGEVAGSMRDWFWGYDDYENEDTVFLYCPRCCYYEKRQKGSDIFCGICGSKMKEIR